MKLKKEGAVSDGCRQITKVKTELDSIELCDARVWGVYSNNFCSCEEEVALLKTLASMEVMKSKDVS